MLLKKDIKPGLEFYIIDCNAKTYTKSYVLSIEEDYLKLKDFPSIDTRRFYKLINIDSKKHPEIYGFTLTMNHKKRYFLTLTEKEAQRHIVENVIPVDMLNIHIEAEQHKAEYMKCVDKLTPLQELEKELLKKLEESVT